MGYAKYNEDNEEIINDRFYMKYNSYQVWGDKTLSKLEELDCKPDLNSEINQIREKISQIQMWLNYNNKLSDIFTCEVVALQIKRQSEHLNRILDRYYNMLYDPKFKSLIDKQGEDLNFNDKQFEEQLNEDFLKYLLKKAANLKNSNMDDSINLQKFYKNINIFLKNVLRVNIGNISKPVIKFIREELLKENNIKLVKCSKCKRYTYEDFNICIYCNYEVN